LDASIEPFAHYSRTFVPLKMLRLGSAPMAVGTANVALLYLGGDALPSPGAVCAFRDREQLLRWVAVVKLEHQRIPFAAVNARMLKQILNDPDAVPPPLVPIAFCSFGFHALLVSLVVSACVLGTVATHF
jgi:hypothetical protein